MRRATWRLLLSLQTSSKAPACVDCSAAVSLSRMHPEITFHCIHNTHLDALWGLRGYSINYPSSTLFGHVCVSWCVLPPDTLLSLRSFSC